MKTKISISPECGNLMFVKQYTTNFIPKSIRVSQTFKGHGICVYLGHIVKGSSTPVAKEVFQSLLNNAGLVTYDDIAEFFGREHMDEFETFLEQKHKEKPKLILAPETKA